MQSKKNQIKLRKYCIFKFCIITTTNTSSQHSPTPPAEPPTSTTGNNQHQEWTANNHLQDQQPPTTTNTIKKQKPLSLGNSHQPPTTTNPRAWNYFISDIFSFLHLQPSITVFLTNVHVALWDSLSLMYFMSELLMYFHVLYLVVTFSF